MFHVMSCNKYKQVTIIHRQTLRIVESEDIQIVLGQKMMGECALCGPCSHVEMGDNGNYWKVHTTNHETAEDAAESAWSLIDHAPDNFSPNYLPEHPRTVRNETPVSLTDNP